MPNGLFIELHVPSFDGIRDFYTAIGFEIVWEREPEGKKGYLALKMEDNVLLFWGGNDQVFDQGYFKRFASNSPRGYAVEIIVMVDDVESYFERVKDRVNLVKTLVLRPWGVMDFRAVDPAGFYLRFSQRYDVLDKRYSVE